MDKLDDDNFILDLRIQFCNEALELLSQIEALLLELEKKESPEAIDELKRHLHCLKGNARAVGFESVSKVSHEMETSLSQGSVRVKIDQFLKTTDRVADATKAFLKTKDPKAFA